MEWTLQDENMREEQLRAAIRGTTLEMHMKENQKNRQIVEEELESDEQIVEEEAEAHSLNKINPPVNNKQVSIYLFNIIIVIIIVRPNEAS